MTNYDVLMEKRYKFAPKYTIHDVATAYSNFIEELDCFICPLHEKGCNRFEMPDTKAGPYSCYDKITKWLESEAV